MSFPEALKVAMDERGWGVLQLRVELHKADYDVSEQTILAWLRDNQDPRYEAIAALGKLFGGTDRFFPQPTPVVSEVRTT